MTGEDYSTLPEEFENNIWKCSINREESEVEYEYSALTFKLKYDCENKKTEDNEVISFSFHKELYSQEVYNWFGTYILEQLEVLDRLNNETR